MRKRQRELRSSIGESARCPLRSREVEWILGAAMRQTSIAITCAVVLSAVACGKSQESQATQLGRAGTGVVSQTGSGAQLRAERTPQPAAQKIAFTGFDPKGEPDIEAAADGSIRVMFNFMPPSWVPDEQRKSLGEFKDFDKRLAKALGIPVSWEDRELFVIHAPRADTVERLKAFLVEQGRSR
jgi:hypothetical protein